jgi:hypothetical protein
VLLAGRGGFVGDRLRSFGAFWSDALRMKPANDS